MLLILLTFTFLSLVGADSCAHPPPAASYSSSLLNGTWYEVGKYQTAGGAKFQDGNVCTSATYNIEDFNSTTAPINVGYSSRKQGSTGAWVNATGTLTGQELPGKFKQQLLFFGRQGPPVDYTVAWIDENDSLVYDCNEDGEGHVEYCAHLLSRVPAIDEQKLRKLQELVKQLGLNTQSVEYKTEDHIDCWDFRTQPHPPLKNEPSNCDCT